MTCEERLEREQNIHKKFLEEYMRESQAMEDEDVAYFGGLDEDKFLEHLLSYLNDPTSRDSMRIAIVRETIIQRQIALGRNA